MQLLEMVQLFSVKYLCTVAEEEARQPPNYAGIQLFLHSSLSGVLI